VTEKDAEWAEFRALAAEYKLSSYVEALVRMCVPSLRAVPVREARGPKKAPKLKSRIGGKAELPADFKWPVTTDKTPLQFVGQLNLAEVHASELPEARLLPATGTLVFFFGVDAPLDKDHCGNAGKAFYFGADAALTLREAPAKAAMPELPSLPIALELQTEELPSVESPFFTLLVAKGEEVTDEVVEKVEDLFGEFAAQYGQCGLHDEVEERPVHRVMGYADPLQSDVYLATEADASGLPLDDWGSLAHHRAAARWRLLFQIDSDVSRNITFGDGGALAFMIREDDLGARRFDNVWVQWQKH
jgi:uncharacterized protein YwqG